MRFPIPRERGDKDAQFGIADVSSFNAYRLILELVFSRRYQRERNNENHRAEAA